MIKKGLLILLCLPLMTLGQQTYVPDDNFEQALIYQGYDTVLDDSVLTANIDTITLMSLNNQNINSLIGVEDFIALEFLYCPGNQLTSLDVSHNHNLIRLNCSYNSISSLDLSNNIALDRLECTYNQLTSLTLNDTALTFLRCSFNSLTTLDLSQNNNLTIAYIFNNQLSSLNIIGAESLFGLYALNNELTFLDVSSNIMLKNLALSNNQLTSLDVSSNSRLSIFGFSKNYLTSIDVSNNSSLWRLYCDSNQLTNINIGSKLLLEAFSCLENNLSQLDFSNVDKTNITVFKTRNNPNLFCIEVEDESWSTALWTDIDSWSSFNEDCNLTNVEEVLKERKPLKIIDVLGKETYYKNNAPLFYIYDNGTVEKRIIIE